MCPVAYNASGLHFRPLFKSAEFATIGSEANIICHLLVFGDFNVFVNYIFIH